jgi:hypothetical protein
MVNSGGATLDTVIHTEQDTAGGGPRRTADHGGPRRGTADRRTRSLLLYTMEYRGLCPLPVPLPFPTIAGAW